MTFKNDIGWVKACNELMQAVTTDVILLNDDTIMISDVVTELREMAYSKPEIGIVGGKSLSPDGSMINNYGVYVAVDGNTAHKHYGKPRESIKAPEAQQAVEGSCIYIKREVIDKIGYFDEGFGMGYREEVDYCFSARMAGYKVISCPTAEYIHLVGQTSSQLGIWSNSYPYFMSKWADNLKLGKV